MFNAYFEEINPHNENSNKYIYNRTAYTGAQAKKKASFYGDRHTNVKFSTRKQKRSGKFLDISTPHFNL